MELRNLIIGVILMSLVIVSFSMVFLPAFNNPFYSAPVSGEHFATFNSSLSSMTNITNDTYTKIKELNPDTSGFLGKLGSVSSAIDLFVSGAWSAIKLIVVAVPSAVFNIFNLLALEFGIPSIVVTGAFAILLIVIVFGVIKLFFKVE